MGTGIMLHEVLIDGGGRILIPKKVREKLGLKPGYTVRMEIRDGKLVISPTLSTEDFIEKTKGCITKGKSSIDPLKLKDIWHQVKGA